MKNTEFEPKEICDFFKGLTKVNHGSGKEDGARDYIIKKIKEMNNENIRIINEIPGESPGERVLVVRKKASDNMEKHETIVLQAHMDMVLFPSTLKAPLTLCECDEEGNPGEGWLKAGGYGLEKGTTLGADDGIGVATALAVLNDNETEYGEIECLFTVQEETDMGGAAGFSPDLLKGRTVINLDSENVNEITFGSAGARIDTLELRAEKKVPLSSGEKAVKLSVSGLKGGHSAMAINDCGANAVKVLAEFLALSSISLKLGALEGGSAVNAIPDRSEAIVVLTSEKYDNFLKLWEEYTQTVKNQYATGDPGIKLTYEENISLENCFDNETTDSLIRTLNLLPHGVIRLNPEDRKEVYTSTNLASIYYINNNFELKTCHRSIYQSDLDLLSQKQKFIAEIYSWTCGEPVDFPQWEPDFNSSLLDISVQTFKELFSKDPVKVVTHAGLECGWIVHKYIDETPKTIQCISIGPTIKEPHGFNERLKKESVSQYYDFLKAIIQKIYHEELRN